MKWTDITTDLLVSNYKKNNYVLKTGVYQLNVFGIRSSGGMTNTFNDIVGALRMNHGNMWEVLLCDATTDPGLYWLQHPMNVAGTAVLMPGQYINSHKTGLHKGQYRALVQCGKLRVWRDKDKDNEYDYTTPQDATNTGINIHHAGTNSTVIDKWSAGCQVLAKLIEFDALMEQVNEHIGKGYPDLFDYTLFEEVKL
jgi:hypothetical protein